MRLALVLLVACNETKPMPAPVPVETLAKVELPSDAELGELAIMGAPGANETWVPVSPFAFLVDDTPHLNLGPAPSWRATDTRGVQSVLAYGETAQLAYGCTGNQVTVTKLDDERDEVSLLAGLVWLTPVGAPWAGRAALIANAGPARAARRELDVGRYRIEIVRTEPTRGVVNVLHDGSQVVHSMTFEGKPLTGGDAIDLVRGGIGVPVPEAAWFLDRERVLLVFKVETLDGLGFKTIVVGPDSGRTVRSMGMYLHRCAPLCAS